MKNAIQLFRKYTPHILLLLGIWIIVVFFIAGGVRTSEKIMDPNHPENVYHFTIFQVMFGKKFFIDSVAYVYFKPNFFGFVILPTLIAGLIIPTFNRINYKNRHFISGLLLLTAGLALFSLPSTVSLGNAWSNPDEIVVSMGAALIVAATITVVFAIINFVVVLVKE